MKTAEEQIAFLEAHSSPTPSKWREEAEWRRANKAWLPYSRKIAIKTAMAMKRQDLTRSDLATRMGCSPQYVSRLLKGEENRLTILSEMATLRRDDSGLPFDI